MAGVAWPLVRAYLAANLPTVVGAGVLVLDGPVKTGENPLAYLSLGAAPSATGDTNAGIFRQEVSPDGFSASELGEIVCELGAVTGLSTVPDVWTTFGLIAAWIQADMTLGGTLTHGSTVTITANVAQAQTSSGAVQRLVISVNYFTRL